MKLSRVVALYRVALVKAIGKVALVKVEFAMLTDGIWVTVTLSADVVMFNDSRTISTTSCNSVIFNVVGLTRYWFGYCGNAIANAKNRATRKMASCMMNQMSVLVPFLQVRVYIVGQGRLRWLADVRVPVPSPFSGPSRTFRQYEEAFERRLKQRIHSLS